MVLVNQWFCKPFQTVFRVLLAQHEVSTGSIHLVARTAHTEGAEERNSEDNLYLTLTLTLSV